MNTPTDISNQALDAIGFADFQLGDIEEGTRPAQVILRAYRQCLMQLLRACHWDFARKQAPLTLLADATTNTPNVGTIVPSPWTYEYAYPIDAMKARFVPGNHGVNPGAPSGNIVPPNNAVPLMTGLGQAPLTGARIIPARFVVATDFNYPPPQGQITWEVQGVSPQGRTVILTNVRHAHLVYTALMLYPSVWDALFRSAFVAYLASEIALPLWAPKDRKFGLALRDQQIKIASQKVIQARISNGNEGFSTANLSVDWMNFRNTGGGFGTWGNGFGSDGPGCLGYGWDQCGMADGSTF